MKMLVPTWPRSIVNAAAPNMKSDVAPIRTLANVPPMRPARGGRMTSGPSRSFSVLSFSFITHFYGTNSQTSTHNPVATIGLLPGRRVPGRGSAQFAFIIASR